MKSPASQFESFPILNISFYRFLPIGNSTAVLSELRTWIKAECSRLGLKGTILLAPEGINGFLAGPEAAIREMNQLLSQREPLASLSQNVPFDFKESWSDGVPFQRLKVKLKKEIISMGHPDIEPIHFTGPRLNPEELKQWLDEGRPVALVDTRNDYEIAKGTFENAITPDLRKFRDFPAQLDEIKKAAGDRPVVMFCTGGIRCEKATAIALKHGLNHVYQLEGGILRYFEKVGKAHYSGDCFVFDEREALDPALKPHT